jgi:hypothetical protein
MRTHAPVKPRNQIRWMEARYVMRLVELSRYASVC